MAIDILVPEEDKALYKNFHFASAARENGLVICSGQIGSQLGSVHEGDGRVRQRAVTCMDRDRRHRAGGAGRSGRDQSGGTR